MNVSTVHSSSLAICQACDVSATPAIHHSSLPVLHAPLSLQISLPFLALGLACPFISIPSSSLDPFSDIHSGITFFLAVKGRHGSHYVPTLNVSYSHITAVFSCLAIWHLRVEQHCFISCHPWLIPLHFVVVFFLTTLSFIYQTSSIVSLHLHKVLRFNVFTTVLYSFTKNINCIQWGPMTSIFLTTSFKFRDELESSEFQN